MPSVGYPINPFTEWFSIFHLHSITLLLFTRPIACRWRRALMLKVLVPQALGLYLSSGNKRLVITVTQPQMRRKLKPYWLVFLFVHFQKLTQSTAWVVHVYQRGKITHATIATIIFYIKSALSHIQSKCHWSRIFFRELIETTIAILGRSWEISIHNGMFCAPAV